MIIKNIFEGIQRHSLLSEIIIVSEEKKRLLIMDIENEGFD